MLVALIRDERRIDAVRHLIRVAGSVLDVCPSRRRPELRERRLQASMRLLPFQRVRAAARRASHGLWSNRRRLLLLSGSVIGSGAMTFGSGAVAS